MDKRGLSPLIATVLLIAFAVSLGAVILNIGVSVAHDACRDVKLEALTLDATPRLCVDYNTETIRMTLDNQGRTVDGFKISALGSIEYNDDVPFLLDRADKKGFEYPIVGAKNVELVTLTPYIQVRSRQRFCTAQAVTYAPPRTC